MKIVTKSGTVYLHRGVFLTRLSEKPISNHPYIMDPTDEVIHDKVIESTYPISPVIGEPMFYRFADGTILRTTDVVEIYPEISTL